MRSIPIPVPCLSEQRRLVAILDEAFDAIAKAKANAEKNVQNARELSEEIFAAVTERHRPSSWARTTVEELAEQRRNAVRTGPFGSQLLHSEFVGEGVAVLGIDNAVNNEFRWGQRRFITRDKFSQLARYQVHPGDVLITIMGTCGRCAIVPNDIPIAINSKHLCCISFDARRCMPEFFHAYFLYHPEAREFLSSRVKGSIMEGLNMSIIKELPVRLPPLAVQHQIVADYTKVRGECQRLVCSYERKLAALGELKQSVLHQAFSGNL